MLDHQPFDHKKVKLKTHFISQKLLVNPYYFLLLFCILMGLNVYHVLDVGKEITFSPLFFVVYAVGQSALEVIVLTLFAHLINTYLHRSLYLFFISVCSLLIFLHFADYILIRFMDLPVVEALPMLFGESIENFIELLHLTGISLMSWIFIGCIALLFIPLVTLIFHYFTSKLLGWMPLSFSVKQGFLGLSVLSLGLLVFDGIGSSSVEKEEFRFYSRLLPWKTTFFSPSHELLAIRGELKEPISEKESLKLLHSTPMAAQKKPNIYLFIAESIREDFVNVDTAPHISHFGKEQGLSMQTFSNANCSHFSWYAIFHSCYPLKWSERKKEWKSGSLPLQALKKLGYKLHVYSSAQLRYYQLGELIFGKKHHLADSFHLHPHYAPITAAEADRKSLDRLIVDHQKKWARSGNVFIVFVDSTHFNYCWPKEMPLRFQPICEEKTDLRISNSLKEIELLKNRYRNAIYYVDSLFGQLVNCLKEKKLYDEALMVFTSDHGEEFYEQGQMFHSSHLSKMQTGVPIYYKLGKKTPSCSTQLSSHVDIFPTLIDVLVGEQPFFKLFDGESLFKKDRFPCVVAARYNGGRNPKEFFIHDGKQKLITKLSRCEKSKKITLLEILSLKNQRDELQKRIPSESKEAYIRAHYGEAFNRLFNGRR